MMRALLAVSFLLVATSCVRPPSIGVFESTAFYARRDHYRIRYSPEATQAGSRNVLNRDWLLQGYERDAHGEPTTVRLARWASPRDVDDLAYTHRVDGSEIFVRTAPLDPVMRDRALDVVMSDTLGSLGGERFADRQTVIRILDRGAATVGNAEAYRAVFETYQVSTQADARSAGRRIYLVIARAAPWTWDRRSEHPSTTGDPMLIVFALVARGEVFMAHVPEFEALLERVDVHVPAR